MKRIGLLLIGMAMGIADLIPGISGATVAYLCGIYGPFLEAITSLRFHSLKSVNVSFFLPLFGGIALSILLFAPVMSYLLLEHKSLLFGFLFGFIAASILFSFKNMRGANYTPFFLGSLISFCLSALSTTGCILGFGFWGLLTAGFIGAAAMLMPGISGSFMLHVLGVYIKVIEALNHPFSSESLKLLLALASGISLGFILCSRLISSLLKLYPTIVSSTLMGFMAGGLRAVWPFNEGRMLFPLIASLGGFCLFILIEVRKLRAESF